MQLNKTLPKLYSAFLDTSTDTLYLLDDVIKSHALLDAVNVPSRDNFDPEVALSMRIEWLTNYVKYTLMTNREKEVYHEMQSSPQVR